VRRYWPLLVVLASLWGSSYLFIKVGVEGGLSPSALMCGRTLLAGSLLFAYLAATLGGRRALSELRAAWRQCAVLGVVSNAVPFWLIAWGEQYVDSGVAAIAQATVPLFTIVLGLRFLPHEPLTRTRWLGLALGLVGVGVLTGLHPGGGWLAVAGTLAVVLSSLSYGIGGVVGQRSISGTSGPVLATGAVLAGALFLAPFAALDFPERVPDGDALLSLVALAVLGTALAQLLFYRLVRFYGTRRASLVTYLMPGFALLYGAVLLDEPLTVAALAGLALILAGVALGSGAAEARAARAAGAPARCR
jgi:drug/metabolite transporter (DMT)-like permease